jgi:hypothetical protein
MKTKDYVMHFDFINLNKSLNIGVGLKGNIIKNYVKHTQVKCVILAVKLKGI